MKKKQDIDVEELLKIAESESGTVDMGPLTDAAEFIYALNIRSGETKVPAYFIYQTYIRWKGRWKKRVAQNVFFRDFQHHFKDFRAEYGKYYLLDESSFDLSEENVWSIRNEKRRQQHAKKLKKQKNDQAKKSIEEK